MKARILAIKFPEHCDGKMMEAARGLTTSGRTRRKEFAGIEKFRISQEFRQIRRLRDTLYHLL
jgi:hypothetical protein